MTINSAGYLKAEENSLGENNLSQRSSFSTFLDSLLTIIVSILYAYPYAGAGHAALG